MQFHFRISLHSLILLIMQGELNFKDQIFVAWTLSTKQQNLSPLKTCTTIYVYNYIYYTHSNLVQY